jgi:hypothetical protein
VTVNIKRMVAAQQQARERAEQERTSRLMYSFERFIREGDPTFADLRRCVTGTGEFDPKKRLKVWLPGLLVRRARRRAGLSAVQPGGGPFLAVAEYLSFDTTESPTEEACLAIDQTQIRHQRYQYRRPDKAGIRVGLRCVREGPGKDAAPTVGIWQNNQGGGEDGRPAGYLARRHPG